MSLFSIRVSQKINTAQNRGLCQMTKPLTPKLSSFHVCDKSDNTVSVGHQIEYFLTHSIGRIPGNLRDLLTCCLRFLSRLLLSQCTAPLTFSSGFLAALSHLSFGASPGILVTPSLCSLPSDSEGAPGLLC